MFKRGLDLIQFPLYGPLEEAFGASKGSTTLTDDEKEKDDLRVMEEHGKGKEGKEDKEDEEEQEEEPVDDLLDDDLEPEEDQEKDDKEDKEDEEEDEEEELKLEEDEDTRNVDFKKIKEKFPEFAKTPEFKQMRDAYFREAKLSKVFENIEDAQEAAENNQTFLKINNEILNQGSFAGLLNAINDADPKALSKAANGFLDTLNTVNKDLYVEVVTPIVRKLAKNIYADGVRQLKRNAESEDGKVLKAVGRNILMWAFPDMDPDDIEKDEQPRVENNTNEKSEKEKELEERETKLAKQAYQGAFATVSNSLEKHLNKTILNGLDPKEELSEFLRDSIVEKITKEIEKQLMADKAYMKRMGSLWTRAGQSGYDKTSLSRILSAYLERARPIIPRLQKEYKARALGRRVREEQPDNVRHISKGRNGRTPNNDGKVDIKRVDTKKIDYKNTSDDDIMSGKVKLRS